MKLNELHVTAKNIPEELNVWWCAIGLLLFCCDRVLWVRRAARKCWAC